MRRQTVRWAHIKPPMHWHLAEHLPAKAGKFLSRDGRSLDSCGVLVRPKKSLVKAPMSPGARLPKLHGEQLHDLVCAWTAQNRPQATILHMIFYCSLITWKRWANMYESSKWLCIQSSSHSSHDWSRLKNSLKATSSKLTCCSSGGDTCAEVETKSGIDLGRTAAAAVVDAETTDKDALFGAAAGYPKDTTH